LKVFRGALRVADRGPCVLTIGNFDGVHRGHQALLSRVKSGAQAHGLASAVMTFEPHPREFLARHLAPERISNLRDKVVAFNRCGIERVFVARFNEQFSRLTPQHFVEDVLVEGAAMRRLLVGEDFRFGAKRGGDTSMLADYAARGAFELEVMPSVIHDGERISSTAVRKALASGNLAHAALLLGRPYSISGRVLHGRKLGRSLGFPTLNLKIDLHPALRGVFAVKVVGLGGPDSRSIPGVASIGLRPTVEHSEHWLLEVHVFDFAEVAYGELITVEFVQKLREEKKYESLEALSAAIGDDAAQARALLGVSPARAATP